MAEPAVAAPAATAAVFMSEQRRLELAANRETLMAVKASLPDEILQAHAAKFYAVTKTKGQQVKAQCMACGHSFSSTGSHRLVKHLVKCSMVPDDIKKPFEVLMRQTECGKAQKRALDNLVKEEAEVAAREHASKQARLKQSCIRAGLKSLEVDEADEAIANFFYANGLSFAAASTEQMSYYREMVKKIQAAPTGYIPPHRRKLAGTLLEDDCYDRMWKRIEQRDPNGAQAMRYGACYVSDGWDSVDNLPLINSAFIAGNDGGVYWRSVDTSGKEKNAEYCAALMIANIYEFGPLEVILVITDTCTTMRKCWSIVMDEFPWVMVLPCQAHVLSLLMKDIGKTKQVCVI